MGNRLSPRDHKLLAAIGEIMHYVWDPIGIAGTPQARDEYESYVGPVFSLLEAGASEPEIAAHLARVAEADMGLPSHHKVSSKAASLLVNWRDSLTLAISGT